ncbi:hypothetical protein CK203_034179 [Vitis vinifera]|uniref:Uncharacterized protein n=1 Tax=Vitis vinifera TaxID=29760 RepID=A0A438IEU9_VITVI|nr:hypothetical protein CK203_034179 [Vitis vinifera]
MVLSGSHHHIIWVLDILTPMIFFFLRHIHFTGTSLQHFPGLACSISSVYGEFRD